MIAISYRRDDSLPIAGRLYDRLQAKFGRQRVFMDFDSIRPGLDFRQQIRDTIDKSRVVIAVIGPNWLGEKSDKSRRIDEPNDFVRLEIAHALQRNIPIIPILVNDIPMPGPDKLPADLAGFAFRHALPLDSGLDFHLHADRLISGISDLLDETPSRKEGGGSLEERHPHPRKRSRSVIAAALIVSFVIVAATAAIVFRMAPRPAGDKNPAQAAPQSSPSIVPPGVVEVDTVPTGAKVWDNGELVGSTPLKREHLPLGNHIFVLSKEGFLPRAVSVDVGNTPWRKQVQLASPAPSYRGMISIKGQAESAARPIIISLNSDLRSGIMTQGSRYGDFVVKFSGFWERDRFNAVTGDVITQPNKVRWTPESFVLRFGDDGRIGWYECISEGRTYSAELQAHAFKGNSAAAP